MDVTRVRVHLLGGLNEIGGNKFLVEDGDDRILLDFGTSLGARGEFFSEFLKPRTNAALTDLLALNLLPHVDGLYRDDLVELSWTELDEEPPESARAYREREDRDFVHGVLVTHAHVDHYGDIAYLDPEIPVHCTATTRAMLGAIQDVGRTGIDDEITYVRERSLGELSSSATFPGELRVDTSQRERDIQACPERGRFQVGPFEVIAVPVDHSVPGAVAFHVETPSGCTIFYTGDVRFHGRLTERTKALRDHAEGLAPDLLLSEGTRIQAEGGEDEAEVEADTRRLVEGADGLAICEFGWKDTTRFDTLQRVAEATDRTLVVQPKLAYMLRALAHRPDVPSEGLDAYDHVAAYVPRQGTMRYRPSDYMRSKIAAGYQADWDTKALRAAWKADDDVTLREPLAHLREGVRATDVREDPGAYLLHLSFWDVTELIDLDPPGGSRWIRCLTEPYSEEMELDLARQESWMRRFGLQHNVTDAGGLEGLTHVSGHASGTDLQGFLASMEADTLVPVHTEREALGAFDGLAGEVVTFPELTFRDAAEGKAVVEL